jgi:uncharacterized repeat protein (TIGR01451 family)
MGAALALPGVAAADRAYSIRFTANAQGDITGTGNTLMTCDEDRDVRCPAARNGQGGSANNNNGIAMRYVDIDADARTFDSSAATLSLPAGARVLFAGLYYGGRLQAGIGGRAAPSPTLRDRVLLRPPNLGDYVSLTADVVDDAPVVGPQPFRLYQGFVDVTDIVRAAGAGEYMVGNVQLGTGLDPDQSGGWALAVAYEDTNQPTRNLTIFDGFQFVTSDSRPVDIPLSGFVTPRSGPVSTRIGFVAIEGDLGTTGDSATLNAGLPSARVLTNAANPPNNFFNASISARDGTQLQAKRPNDLNQFGFDADVFDATGLLANGQTSTTIQLATSGDGFAPQGVSFATDLFAPSLRVVKAVDRTQAELGDVLTYTVAVSNVGLDAATNVTLRDAIPAGTTYVPGSLAIDGAGKTDAAGDDTAEFDADGEAVVMRLGAGANASNGGRLAVGAPATTIRFQARVNDRLERSFVVRNRATVGYRSETLGQPGATTSPDVLTRILVPDLAIDKSHTGEFVAGRTVPFTLAVRNVGEASTRGAVTVTDRLPDVMSFVGAPAGDGWVCTTAGRALSCTRSDPLAPGADYPPIRYTARVAAGAAPVTLLNTASVATDGDGNPTNDSDSDGGESRPPSIDLAIRKVALTPRAFPGEEVRFRLRVTNRGPDTATRVVVRDVLPSGLTLVSAAPSRGTCAGAVCRLGRLRPGRSARIDLTALAAQDTGGRVLVDRALVTGREPDHNRANNADRAAVLIVPLVDIVVEKTTAAPQVEAGGDATFLVVVRNDGPSDASGVAVRDLLPAELVPVSATPTQGSCVTPTACTLGDLAAGASAQIVIVARSDASLVRRTLTNAAAALAAQPDRDLANNFDTSTVTFVAPPPLPAEVVVTKTASATIVSVGDPFSYTVTARNRGPGTAGSVVVTETPDPALDLISAVPSQGTCSLVVPVRCDIGALAPGASATVLVTVRALAAGPLRNGVTAITSTNTTTSPPERIAVAGTVARSGPRVGLRKRASRRSVRSGGRVTFTLTATARGRGTARDVEVCDRMPRGFTVVSAGNARLSNGRWCTRIASLESGTSRTLRIVARAPSVTGARAATNVATLAFGDQPPRFALVRIVVVPPRAGFTG